MSPSLQTDSKEGVNSDQLMDRGSRRKPTWVKSTADIRASRCDVPRSSSKNPGSTTSRANVREPGTALPHKSREVPEQESKDNGESGQAQPRSGSSKPEPANPKASAANSSCAMLCSGDGKLG